MLAALSAPGVLAQDDAWMAQAYESALTRYANGQTNAAFTALEELENRQIEAGHGSDLLAAQRGVIGELASRDPQAVPALVLLHHDAALRYREFRRQRLAGHALRVLLEIGAAPQVRGGELPIRRVAGLALTSLAGGVVAANPADAVELLRRATELDPRDAHALLALGAIHEKHGRYAEAVATLSRRVAVAPTPEARLRLAINLRRLGAVAEAEPMLAALETAPTEWIAILASQETGALLADQNRLRDAARRLRAAVARHPGEGSLCIQLSFVLERSGDPRAALDVAREASRDQGEAGGDDHPTPRLLYNRWPMHAFADAQAALRQIAGPELARLAPALGGAVGARG